MPLFAGIILPCSGLTIVSGFTHVCFYVSKFGYLFLS